MTRPTHAQYRARRVFVGLDGVRALAVLAVVWHHAGATGWPPMTANGFLGVDVFFVLSGFLIVTLLLRERERHGTIALRAFYMRRTLRIFPLYYGVVLGLVALHWVSPRALTAPAANFAPILLTYSSDLVAIPGALSVTWSLAAEEQFYLVWPAVERFFGRAWWAAWWAGVVVSSAFNFGLLPHHGLPILQATFTPILLGVGLAHALHHRRSFESLVRVLGHRTAPWMGAVGLLALINLSGDLAGVPRLAIHVVVAYTLGAMVVRNATFGGLFTAWPLRRLGRVSYGVYLLHMFVMALLGAAAPALPAALRFGLVILATWAVAEVSYHWFERRFLLLKRSFAR